ncbi:MAG: AraC family transcriptional regulator [Rhodovulum sulfidophilum]|uniref:AraC family transcriptional regulator n=1 Tax=Rhodovulum sulfidophilum TaxID=35806 RepID=A0A2W5N4G5_RHOSU|nr:MAG: AraC family transcriptional regulator [Rhodovulum sulfidophilum]
MSYHHDFTGETEGIRPVVPVRWRQVGGLMGAFWEARGEAGGRGYYVSANPRISVFFADVSSIRVAHSDGRGARAERPLARAFYIPAGVPMWTSFTKTLVFSHLDLHLDLESAVRFLGPAVDRSAALDLVRRPAERAEAVELEGLARALAAEITRPARARSRVEPLAAALFAGLVAPGAADPGDGRLTPAQMRRITARFDAGGGRRLSVAEMSETVSLSGSWFSTVFKNTTGLTPSQWQLGRRVELARGLLAEGGASVAEIAHDLGFTDQAHFTRVFRRHAGETPAAWQRARRGG